ncbi:hypothetical protein [Catenulispora pinisilvae]|uniref:hypothetical protein n=1 Tax=Catenulispora pinisilvae TaxID=2705253 RepID=UPI0018911F9C|nr:hypothetical protein [Catenulispora pinisilvae]
MTIDTQNLRLRHEALPERVAHYGGQIPALAPIQLDFDEEERSVTARTAATSELIELWQAG